ncbi:hypothetical protein [Rubritalea sp.]|uniref:hypothetical protein n=1 Tax=Rubritalea sp. TaxID=2109375 RepID=UPI003EF2F0F0
MNNKTTLSLLSGALLSGAAFAGPVVVDVVEVEPSFEGEIYAGYSSDYIFRGAYFGDDLVDAGINLSKSAWGVDFATGAWYGSYDNGTTNQAEDELDLFFEMSKDFGFARFTTGYIWYNTDNGHGTSTDVAEVYLGVSKDFCWGINSSLTYFFDASGVLSSDEGDNNGYTELVLGKEDLFFEGVDLTNTLGYLAEKGKLNQNTTTVSYDLDISENATLTPYLAYSWELSGLDTHGPLAPSDEKNRFYGGLSLSVSF